MDEPAKKRLGQIGRFAWQGLGIYILHLARWPLRCLQWLQLVGVPKMFHRRLRSQKCETR
jgi:hypothetical protein